MIIDHSCLRDFDELLVHGQRLSAKMVLLWYHHRCAPLLVALILKSERPAAHAAACSHDLCVSARSYHGLPGWATQLTALQYRACLNDEGATYTVRNHPLPITEQESIEQQTILSVLASLFIIIPLVSPIVAVMSILWHHKCRTRQSTQCWRGSRSLRKPRSLLTTQI
jgi:hypothetical protein